MGAITEESTERATLGELARYFLRLGFTAFGGPAAHIAIMEDDVVARRRWLTRAHFMDMLAATQLVPGPNSTEMAIHVGYLQQGLPGLVIAGACFILPAFLIVLALSIGYVAYGALPALGALAFVVALIAPFDPVWVIVAGGLAGVALAQGLHAGSTLLALLLRNPWSDIVPDNSTPIARIVRMGADCLYGAIRVNLFNPSNLWSLATVALVQAAADSSLWRLALFFL